MAQSEQVTGKSTPLTGLHKKLGARMVTFAGYEMPIQFEGVMAEHNWTRRHCGLFDVSHMGPSFLELKSGVGGGEAAHKEIAALIETLVPSDIAGLPPGKAQLTVLLNESGGILDDLIITRPADPAQAGRLYIVVNGAMKEQDWSIFEDKLAAKCRLERADDRILIALQGPEAIEVVAERFAEARDLAFMQSFEIPFDDEEIIVSRCGYTGEDGFELLIPASTGYRLVEAFLADERVRPVGLGARDSLRLEAGLCLYGHDLSPDISPIEAGLAWTIPERRRKAADFPGAERILSELSGGAKRKRVGIRPLGRAPAREGTEIHDTNGTKIGEVTSGGFGPTANGPVAMGYVDTALAAEGTEGHAASDPLAKSDQIGRDTV